MPKVTEAPELVKSEADKITLKWPSWTGAISEGYSVVYKVEYMEYYSKDKIWHEGVNFEYFFFVLKDPTFNASLNGG